MQLIFLKRKYTKFFKENKTLFEIHNKIKLKKKNKNKNNKNKKNILKLMF